MNQVPQKLIEFDNFPSHQSLQYFNMAARKLTFATLAALLVATGDAQSANPGLGVNSHAQGATEEVTPGGGPNG